MAEENVTAEVGGVAVDRLRSLIERIERLEEEKKGIQSDIRDIFAEAKAIYGLRRVRFALRMSYILVALG